MSEATKLNLFCMRGHCIKNWVLNGWLPNEIDNWLEFFLLRVIVESIQDHLDTSNDTWDGTELMANHG